MQRQGWSWLRVVNRQREYRLFSLYSSTRLSARRSFTDYAVFTSSLNKRYYSLIGDMYSAVSVLINKEFIFHFLTSKVLSFVSWP